MPVSAQRYPPATFTTEGFVRAMAPIKVVLDSFQNENHDCFSLESQGRFARLIERQQSDEFGPSKTYLRSLVRKFVSRVDASNHDTENDCLLELIIHFSMIKDNVLPNPLQCCHASFWLCQSPQQDLLRLRVFPQHNDVALKVWEAGACLAEYFLENPHHVKGKQCCELGAGVGLTGLVVTGYCAPTNIHLSDYTEACLSNLQHNIQINNVWLRKRVGSVRLQEIITQGYLDWEEYANDESTFSTDDKHAESKEMSAAKMSQAQVLLAADVVYDVSVIPCLVQTVKRFLSTGDSKKVAIFATTLRNKTTFDTFERHLGDKGIECDYVESEILEKMPYHFPVYNVQPRTDVRICFMKLP